MDRGRIARWIAAGFGTGFAPVAAGTVASAVATLVGAALLWWSPLVLLAAALLATFGGLWAVRAAQVEGDPGWVTIDEFAGQWIALLGLATVTPLGLLAAFAAVPVLRRDQAGAGRLGRSPARRRRDHGGRPDRRRPGGGILWAVRSHWPGALG